jgi:hypothetical protein
MHPEVSLAAGEPRSKSQVDFIMAVGAGRDDEAVFEWTHMSR